MISSAPDFVMVGGQHDGKVYLIASTTLTEVELRMEAEHDDFPYQHYGLPRQRPNYRHFITAEMRDWVQVVADDYPTAFRTLFDSWSPEQERPELEAHRASIAGAAPKAIAP